MDGSGYLDTDILRPNEDFERLRRGLHLQRRSGIKVKLDFDAPQWWTLEFIKFADSLASQKLRAAARSYVKAGRVVEVKVDPGVVVAKVQGSRKAPYHVRLYSPLPKPEQIEAIKRGLCESAIFGALLLAGEMPVVVRDVFTSCGAALTPLASGRGRMLCSCSEPEDICKHILAVLFVVIDAFDRDPFLLLRLRGLDKEELLHALTLPRGAPAAAVDPQVGGEADDDGRSAPSDSSSAEPQADGSFYGDAQLAAELSLSRGAPRSETPPPPLFDFPLWRGETPFRDSIRPYYETARKAIRQG